MTTESSHSVIETSHIHEAPCRGSCTDFGMRHIFSLSSWELGVSFLLILPQQSLSHMACLDEAGVHSWVNYMDNRTRMLWSYCANPQNAQPLELGVPPLRMVWTSVCGPARQSKLPAFLTRGSLLRCVAILHAELTHNCQSLCSYMGSS